LITSPNNCLDNVRVAAPCSVSWESMSGTNVVRFCDQCELHVYDFSQLTREEAESLVAGTEGRICGRLYRRADGTILTKDCPAGLRAIRRRVGRMATAAVAALLSLGANVFGQNITRASREGAGEQRATLKRTFLGRRPQEGHATFMGVVTDTQGSVIADAEVTITNEKTKHRRSVKSDADGQFKFGLLEPGSYTLSIESPGFETYAREHLSLHSNEELRFDVTLNVGATMGVILCEEPPSKGIVIDGVRISINED
jgi:Carboxypeptidase regulatory-like domain